MCDDALSLSGGSFSVAVSPLECGRGYVLLHLVTHRRQRILCDEPVRRALREAVSRVRARRPFNIDAGVLLPDHLHCIWSLPPGDADFGFR
ncbi:MAG: transposase [Uliginosibacterium sp.]|nr:transposase [Uliginosibacterium sp.]